MGRVHFLEGRTMSTSRPTEYVPPEEGGFPHAALSDTRADTASVPPELADRFVLLRVLRQALEPSRAVVLRVRDLKSPTPDVPLVLKWYHRLHAPDEAVSRVLREEEGPHLERLLESGRANGHDYHLYRSHGETHLDDYQRDHPGEMDPDQLGEIVRQLHAAVSFLHEHEIVHRDITPDNIMIEFHTDVPEVVLIDFGAAVHRPDEKVRPSDWRGKPHYLAPEAGARHQTVSEAGDWWSVGMVVAQLALGRHPMDERDDEAVSYAIATRDPDVSGIRDRRIRRLCEGLLTRNPEHRWGADEVEAWLAGEIRDIAPRHIAGLPGEPPEPELRPFTFVGMRFTQREDLARALDHYHASADRMLADPESRAALVEWLGQFEAAAVHDGERSALVALREELRDPPDPVVTMRLINWLGPRIEAACWGTPLTARGIRELSRAAQQGDAGSLQLVKHLRRFPEILETLAVRPAGEGLDKAARRWQTLRSGWSHLVRELRGDPDFGGRRLARILQQTPALDARLLELAREPERMTARLSAGIRAHQNALPAEVPWFNRLVAASDDPLWLLAAHLLVPQARREAEIRHARFLEQEAERLMEEDQDGVIAVMRRLDRLPTLGWALMGATTLTAPWCFVIGLADVLGRASQEAVVIGWLLALPAAAAVFAAELLTAVYIGPPAYHPRRSLAGLLIRTAERPASVTLSRRRTLIVATAFVSLLFLLGFEALTAVPWLWPAVMTAASLGWSLYRCHRWRRERRTRRNRAMAVRGGFAPTPVTADTTRATSTTGAET